MGIFLLIGGGLIAGYIVLRMLSRWLEPVWLAALLAIAGLGFLDLGMVDSPLGLRLAGPSDDPYAELGEVYIAVLFGMPFMIGGLVGAIRGRIIAGRQNVRD